MTDVTKILTGVKGTLLLLPESFDTNSTITWTSSSQYRHINNLLYYKWDVNGSHFVDYALTSPIYEDVETFKLKGSYQKDMVHNHKIIKGVMHRPGDTQIGELDIRYGGIAHTDGHFNLTTPFHKLPWLKSILNINYVEEQSDNKIELFWPNKTASLNSTHQYRPREGGFTQTGTVSLSVPLNTQHLVNTEYNYVQSEKWSNGNATIDLDLERFVKASFKQLLSKSNRDLDLATTDIEVENVHTPVGVKYIHEFDTTGNIDVKQATVFHLHNATKFNVTGILDVYTYDVGKNLELTAIHGNRTLTFENKYESVDRELKQGSKMKWADDVWLKYNIHLTNMTYNDTESQQLVMNVWYPRRSFNLIGVYNLQDTMLDGNARLTWNVRDENKTAELKGKWNNPPLAEGNQHNIDLSLSHPSFRKDVNLKGQYISTPAIMSNISLELQYSDYENEYLKLRSILTDNSNGPIRDYKFALKCTHPSTNLDLDMKSDINIRNRWYYFNNYYRFQKSLFYEKLRHNNMLINLSNSSIHWERANESYYYKVNGTWDLTYPEYKAFVTVLRPTGNDTGVAVLSTRDKSLIAHFNSTDDISYHIIGRIIDTRSAKLDAWRDFDDVTTADLASYIRLNHSRLLTSSFVWRPEIFSEIKATAVYTLKALYGQINETLVIIKEMPMEAHLALRNIWGDAKPRVREFLDDLNDLHVIKDDLDEFHIFLNESYNHNDFYVKDIVEFTYYVLDEMAIRNHLESLPGIVNDMWGMMGNTSQSIKQSLTYVAETIRMAYSNFLESVNKVLEADFMELVSARLEAMIMQYDNFVRDMHMRLLEYWEETWVNATSRLYTYWHDLLKSIEPLFFKVLDYTETFVVSIWHSMMDFFYSRTQELTDSPYFNYVSTFSHEVDKIYKDLITNDLVTNIKKYSKKSFNFLWQKVEKYIPFKEEIMQLYAEFKNAWESFMKTKQVVYIKDKYTEAYVRLRWWYDYFLIGEALDRVGEIIYQKVTDMAKTALQYEELHRTPKTHFVFDPNEGTILLEQKLPMSWHAFNRTPDFSEISEYRAVRDFIDDWLNTNKSIWSYYYELRPYMDLDNIMPPFAGNSVLTLPAVIEDFTLDRHTDALTVRSRNGLLIECDFLFRTCKLQVTGWYYASLGGLLGTYNNEQYDEMQLPNGTLTNSSITLGRGWGLKHISPVLPLVREDRGNDTQCDKFFLNKVSPLRPCFSVIDATPFSAECSRGADACALANACITPQGDIIEEGSFYQMHDVPNTTDVVFIVEAQYCNKNMRKRKNLDLFIEAFDTRLQGSGITDNRYAIVGYGGSGVYSEPRALYVDNHVFADAIQIPLHFDALQIGIDSTHAYTNKDYEHLKGDMDLRKQVRLPKDKLGLCASLALETNGTLLAGGKLQGERGTARRFATIAGARVAQTATACARASCECRDTRLHCRPCADIARMVRNYQHIQ
ncbi:unnamed protein product [Diatraea saccharalis]|uniref:VWFD domain-containing protein n=1 Tax=Diatraea saccharalis TaxID=40085 RepID=A0A9N9RA82_9NEOP|nr:unnamed protein product [Diatraea saccharalis]